MGSEPGDREEGWGRKGGCPTRMARVSNRIGRMGAPGEYVWVSHGDKIGDVWVSPVRRSMRSGPGDRDGAAPRSCALGLVEPYRGAFEPRAAGD